MDTESLELWMAVDRRSEQSAIVSAVSILRHRPSGSLTDLKICHLPGDPPSLWLWDRLVRRDGTPVRLSAVEVEPKEFRHCKGMFGSLAAYLRLYIPSLSQAEFPLYVDTDTVFFEDVGRITTETVFSGEPVAMPAMGRCENQPAVERALIEASGKPLSELYFCSGICVFDRMKFLASNTLEACADLARSASQQLMFCDQSLLNSVCRRIARVDGRWNQAAFPDRDGRQMETARGGVHFLGAPKPWDLLGEFFHPHAELWVSAARESGMSWPLAQRYLRREDWRRAWRIRAQYRRWMPKQPQAAG